MPLTLPSADDLGVRAPDPRTNVVQTSGGAAVGAAMERAGQQLQATGNSIQEKQDKVEMARAKSYFLSEQIKANSDFENDQDAATMTDRYSKRLDDARKNALGMLSNKSDQESLGLDLAPDYERGVAGVKSLSYKRTVDTGRANLQEATDTNLQSILQAPDEASRTAVQKSQADLIRTNKERGFLTAEEAQKKGQEFVQDYATQRAQVEMDSNPKGLLQMLKPTAANTHISELSQTTANKYKGVSPSYLTTTAAIETGGTFDATSKNANSGAAGLFQITPDTARSLNVKDPHNPAQAADGTARLAVDNARILKNAGAPISDANLYLAHQQGGPQAAALLNNPNDNVVDVLATVYKTSKNTDEQARAKARAAVIQNGGTTTSTAKDFSSHWTDKYAEFESKYATPAAAPATDPVANATGSATQVKTDGVQVAANDGGVVGQNIPVASPNTPGTLAHFEKTGTWVDFLPYDKRVTLINNAETKIREDRVVNKQLLEAQTKDSNAMALQGFVDPKPPSLSDFENAYEPNEAELRYREYNQTQKVAGTIHQSATMTPGEQATTLIALKPQPGPGFATDQKNYEALQAGITEANTARKADPIAFAQKYKMDPSAQPLDFKDAENLPQQLAQRGNLGVTMNHDYGVPLRVFTEPEAQTLATAMNGMTANQRLGTLSSISAGLQDNPTAYVAAMGQLRPASPVTAYAGTYLGLKGSVTDAKNLSVTPQAVASGILQGEDLINPPKDSEGKETKPAIKMPSPEGSTFLGGMRSDFNDTWGPALQGQPQAANDAFEATRSYYAYLSAQAGDYDGKYDADRFTQSMKAVMGNGRPAEIGDGSVIPPWGMAEDQFKDGAKVAFNRAIQQQGLKNWSFEDATFMGTGRPGEYTISNGTMNMVDKKGFPVLVHVTQDDVETDPLFPIPGVPKSVARELNRQRDATNRKAGAK